MQGRKILGKQMALEVTLRRGNVISVSTMRFSGEMQVNSSPCVAALYNDALNDMNTTFWIDTSGHRSRYARHTRSYLRARPATFPHVGRGIRSGLFELLLPESAIWRSLSKPGKRSIAMNRT